MLQRVALTLLDIGSAAAVVVGAYEIYGPAGWIVGGLAGALISWRFSPDTERAAPE